MAGIIIFNVLMIALAGSAASGLVPASRIGSTLEWLHAIIGITSPPREKSRLFALVWIGSALLIADGLLFLLVFLTRHLIGSR